MELNFKKREVKVNFYGEKISLNFPSSLMLREYQERLLKEGTDYLEETYLFMEKLGVSRKILEACEMPDLEELVSVVCGQKKI